MSTTSSTATGTSVRPAAHHLRRALAWIALAVVVAAALPAILLLAQHAGSSPRSATPATVSAPAQRAGDAGRRLEQINATTDESAAQAPSGHTLRSN